MSNRNGDRGKRAERQREAATNPGPKPGDFPLGSLQSRVAARSALENRKSTGEAIRFITGIARPEWAPPWEECQSGDMQIVFTDDPSLEEKEQLK